LALCFLLACHSTPKEHRADATRKLTAMVDSVTTAVADKFPVEPAAPPDAPQSCVGTFNNDKGTVKIGYSRLITIPHDTDGPSFADRSSVYLRSHGYQVDKIERAADPQLAYFVARREGYQLLVDVNPREGRVSITAATPCVKP
jgi:hypothetical protein